MLDRSPTRTRWTVVVLALLAWAWLGVVRAAPPSAGQGETGAEESSGAGPESSEAGLESTPITAAVAGAVAKGATRAEAERTATIERLQRRTAGITALIAGELDPAVDLTELLSVDLLAPDAGDLQAMLEAVVEGRRARAEAERIAAEQQQRRRRTPPEPAVLADPPPLPGPDADPLTRARAELRRAFWQFWTLPEGQRAALIQAHRERRAAASERREAEARAKLRLEQMRREAQQLAALMAGELDVSVDPKSLLRVDLSAVDELASDDRLARALAALRPQPETSPGGEGEGESETGGAPETGGEPKPEPKPELAAELASAAAELDAQRLKFLALTPTERQRLLERHAERQRSAAEAAAAAEQLEADAALVTQAEEELTEAVDKAAQAKRERELAEVAAAQARSEALRRIAEERARLLGVKEAHAVYEVELATRKKQAVDAHEVALEWDRKVTELAGIRAGEAREQAADAMYGDLRGALTDARERLRATLDTISSAESGVEPVGEPLAGLPGDVDRSDLAELRAELEASEQALLELEREVVWAAADGGRDDIVMLNQARLTLLDLASDELRDRMTGFGSEGVAQGGREIDQIVLELRYRVLALPRIGRKLVDDLETSPLPVIFAILKLAFAVLVFRYWRKLAESTLERARDDFLNKDSGNRRLNTAAALTLWYFDRIRKPLEWLALFAAVYTIVLAGAEVLEIEVLWLIVLWLNVGYTVILFVDAVAAHEAMVYGRGNSLTAQLRIRSLRLVGLTVVLTGLVLSLTEETVGRGAIHKWVRSLIWIAAVPILLVLIRWWRDYVFKLIQSDKDIPDNALVRWIRANTEGWASFPAATIAGAYVFGRGLARWLLRRATSFEITRRLLAWMFRREVARQASARHHDQEQLEPLAPADYARFDPAKLVEDVTALAEPMQAVASDILAEVIALKTSSRGTLSAIIGERGAGKTTFLRRLSAALEDHANTHVHEPAAEHDGEGERHDEYGRLTVRVIQCPPGGFRQLQRAIAEALGLPRNAAREQIVAALSAQTPLVFLIDDAHRLVRPAIGGLEGLDQFADFAREVSGDASWIATIGAAAWQYVSRARGDRVFFDQVLTLPAWNEQQIGALVRERTGAAGLTADFGDIAIPRQFDVATVGEGEERPTEEQRNELGYYRILWDYAKGNPAVALHFWRESLWMAGEGPDAKTVKVRLFKEPEALTLDEVGATMHFVLRGVVQLEVASPADLVACTQLPPAEVADALRFALARGWVDRVGSYGDRYRVTWHWYRAITNMLRRQHLLAI